MRNRIFALILAGVMILSLAACKDAADKPVTDGTEDPGNEVILTPPPEDDPIEVAIPEALDILISSLKDFGYTATYKEAENKTVEYFLYPELHHKYTVTVSNGEEIYLYGYENYEKTAEHLSCYSASGWEYEFAKPDGSIISTSIDYIAPVNFWQMDTSVIEYASEKGELYPAVFAACGKEVVGNGGGEYLPDYAKSYIDAASAEGYTCDIVGISLSDAVNTDAFVIQTRLSKDGQVQGDVYIYKYDSIAEVMAHSPSPIEPPVLSTVTVWTDTENYVAYQYIGDSQNIVSVLDKTFSDGVAQLSVNNLQYVRGGLESDKTVTVYTTYDELTGGVQLDLREGHPYIPYTREWFEENNLMVVTITENSGSNRHELRYVTRSGNSVNASINRFVPKTGTCDMVTWQIYIGLSKAETEGATSYSVNLLYGDFGYFEDIKKVYHFDDNIVRTNYFGEYGKMPSVAVIESKSQLDDYYKKWSGVFDLGSNSTVYSDTSIGFADTFDIYTEEWFENNILLMGIVEEGSGSIRHRIDGVYIDNGKLCLRYTRLLPEVVTADMAAWHMMAGISRMDLEGVDLSTAFIASNDDKQVDRTLFPAAYITEDRLDDVREYMIGNYDKYDILDFWGQPDRQSSGLESYSYSVPNGVLVNVRFDSTTKTVTDVWLGKVSSLSPEMAFPGNVNADNLTLFRDYFSGYSYQDVIEQWGRPDEETDGIGAVQYNIDIFSYVELLFDSDGIVNDIRLVSELPALEDITLENAEEIKAKLIGNYKEPNFSVAWGRPDGQGSGMYFETWYSSKGVHITIYFDNTTNDAVDVIISDSIVAPEDAWRFTEQLRAHLIGEVDYNWFAEKWGKPDGQLSGFWGDIWQATDNVQIVVYYDANGVVEEIITHSELLGKQAFSTDMLDRLKEQTVGKYTIGEVEHFWAPAEPDNTGADNRRYEISENTFVVFSYDDESGLITDVEILCRTPKADE